MNAGLIIDAVADIRLVGGTAHEGEPIIPSPMGHLGEAFPYGRDQMAHNADVAGGQEFTKASVWRPHVRWSDPKFDVHKVQQPVPCVAVQTLFEVRAEASAPDLAVRHGVAARFVDV